MHPMKPVANCWTASNFQQTSRSDLKALNELYFRNDLFLPNRFHLANSGRHVFHFEFPDVPSQASLFDPVKIVNSTITRHRSRPTSE